MAYIALREAIISISTLAAIGSAATAMVAGRVGSSRA
jgi:hypothetical protein